MTNETTRIDLRGPLLVLGAAIMWSTGGVCIKLLSEWRPLAASSGRSLVTALFFLTLLGGRIIPARASISRVILGAVAYAGVVTAFVFATRLTTAANAILLQSTSPLWVAAWGFLTGDEKPTWRELTGLAIGGLGAAMCIAGTKIDPTKSLEHAQLGNMLALLSGVSFATLMVVLRHTGLEADAERASGKPGTGTLVLFYGNLLAGLVGIHALIPLLGTPGIPGKPVWMGLALILWLGVGQLGGGYFLFERGVRTTRALTASLISLAEPVLNPVWVAFVVGERPPSATIFGGVCVLIACVLAMPRRQA